MDTEAKVTSFEKRHADALRTIAPNIVQDESASWQVRKSAETRYYILNTTLDCLAECGYPKTTTKLVTQRANISRGALLHHFATRQDLIKQAIEFTFYRQMDNFYKKIIQLSEQERVHEIAGIDVYWEFLKSKEFQAYSELAMASRTDQELREIFVPKDIEFQRLWGDELPYLFPEWQGRDEELQLARDLINTSMQGLVFNSHGIASKERRARLRKLIAAISSQIRLGQLELPKISKADVAKAK